MRFLVVDDNQDDIRVLSNNIEILMKEKKLGFEIDICKTKEQLLTNFMKYDCIFLDIEIGKYNGIDLGGELCGLGCNKPIIITSKFNKYLIDGYKINAKRYLLKPITRKIFSIEMNDVITKYLYNSKFLFDPNISASKIYYRDILFIEYFNRTSILHLLNGEKIESRYSLKKWTELLIDFPFIQTHKAYIVSITKIIAIYKSIVALEKDATAPLSRHFKANVEEAYINNLHGEL